MNELTNPVALSKQIDDLIEQVKFHQANEKRLQEELRILRDKVAKEEG